MRPATIVESLRRRRLLAVLAVVTVLTASVSAVAATSAVSPPQVLNYQVYVGGKGKANPRLAPVTIGFINGQGGPPNFNFPQATNVIRAGVKMVNAELGGVHGHPVKLNECFWAPGGGGRRPVRPADGQRQGDGGDPLRIRDRREPVDLRDREGHEADRRRRHRERGRPDGEEHVLPERQPDERARPLRHLHEAVPAQGEDHRHRLPDRPRCRDRALRRSRRAWSRSGSR